MRFSDKANVAQLDSFEQVIDVRSPAEYALDHIPGAINAPVLDDAQRAAIGTLYKQVSPFAARRLGAALVARNIGLHIETLFQDRDKSWRPLVYCWRGGQRSGAMTHVLRQIGWQAAQLAGGYKSFRREVVLQIDAWAPQFRYIVLCGETGSGKSHLLTALAAQGEQVLDLEALARHRGSVLGQLPQTPQPVQKNFDTQLWSVLRTLKLDRPVYVEAESKSIGALRVPDTLMNAIRNAECVQLHVPPAERVRFLLDEYAFFVSNPDLLTQRLDILRPLYGNKTIAKWHAEIDTCDWESFVGGLLSAHYDPLYSRSTQHNFVRLQNATHLDLQTLSHEEIEAAATRLAAQMGSAVNTS
jgi:tRNA 2-selenouridine synthase